MVRGMRKCCVGISYPDGSEEGWFERRRGLRLRISVGRRLRRIRDDGAAVSGADRDGAAVSGADKDGAVGRRVRLVGCFVPRNGDLERRKGRRVFLVGCGGEVIGEVERIWSNEWCVN